MDVCKPTLGESREMGKSRKIHTYVRTSTGYHGDLWDYSVLFCLWS